MSGDAKTTKFMLGDATVMFGPTAEVFDLNPTDHSVGLTKSVSVTSEPQFTDLTQGVKNSRVFSVMTGNNVQASMEVYEYTARNLAYAAGLDGDTITPATGASTLDANITPADTDFDVATGEGSNFNVGDWIFIGTNDDVSVRRVTAISTDTITVHAAFVNAHTAGEVVYARTRIAVGTKEDQPYLGCKIVGTLANGDDIGMIYPKVRITSGLTMGFASDDFQNMAFELQMYDLVTTDPLYAEFGGAQGFAMI